jgi:hypothetical protein
MPSLEELLNKVKDHKTQEIGHTEWKPPKTTESKP